MLDHIGFSVSDVAASRAFYVAALAPIGVGIEAEFGDHIGFGRDGRAQFWFGGGGMPAGGIHLAFTTKSRAEVRAFHEDRKSTRLNSSHLRTSRMPSSA